MQESEKNQTRINDPGAKDISGTTEKWFKLMFEQSTLGMAISDNAFRFITANPAFCSMLGYTDAELSKLTFKDITHPDHIAQDTEAIQKLAKGEIKSYKTEKRYVAKSGSVFAGAVTVTAIFDAAGKHMHSLVVLEDISQRKRVEASLQESEERFSKAFKMSPYSYMIANMDDGAIIEVNDAFTTISGFTRDEALGSSSIKLNFWINVEDRKSMLSALRDGGVVKQMETTLRAKNGNIKTVLLFARVIHLGQKSCILSIIEDITQRKQAEEAVFAEKERLAVTLRSIGDAVIATDLQGNIALMNNVAETLTGWTLKEAAGKPLTKVFKVINELTREHLENPVEKVLSTGDVIELANHTLLLSRDGAERVIADSGAPIKDNNDKIIGVVLVFRDITEKQKLMDIIQRTTKLDSLGILAGGIAHDFNNLLTGIYGYMDLARSVSKEPRVTEYFDTMFATMKRAKALTQQLLTFSKGGAPIQKTTPLVSFIQETAQFALSGSNISCRFSMPENLWPSNIDTNQIAQVIDNIVINAQQAMPNGGTIEISAENISFREYEHPPLTKGEYVKVSIKDFGIGIPKDIMPRIFDPFYTTKLKGHGLGLATCYSIVNRHGGCIDVESEPGKGSAFHVFLPASLETIIAEAAVVCEHKGSGLIVVMDDEEVVRDTFQQILEMLGYTVIGKNNGKEVIDFYSNKSDKQQISAMIFDLTIPDGMGGLETVTEIRKLDAAATKIPIFVSSGYADNTVMKNPIDYGFTASISKPFTISDLSELLNKYLKGVVQ